jgi:hypothetical protein
MYKETIKEFLSNPGVKDALKEGDLELVALLASSVGNLRRDPDLRTLSNFLMGKLKER